MAVSGRSAVTVIVGKEHALDQRVLDLALDESSALRI